MQVLVFDRGRHQLPHRPTTFTALQAWAVERLHGSTQSLLFGGRAAVFRFGCAVCSKGSSIFFHSVFAGGGLWTSASGLSAALQSTRRPRRPRRVQLPRLLRRSARSGMLRRLVGFTLTSAIHDGCRGCGRFPVDGLQELSCCFGRSLGPGLHCRRSSFCSSGACRASVSEDLRT